MSRLFGASLHILCLASVILLLQGYLHRAVRSNTAKIIKSSSHTTLFHSKKTSSSNDKIRIRLISDYKEIGKKGEISMVSKALFTNVLEPKKIAEKVTDDEMASITQAASAKEQASIALAEELANKLITNSVIKRMKIGANSQLFGSCSTKVIVETIKEGYPMYGDVLSGKAVGVTKLSGSEGPVGNNEIRKAGVYQVEIKLHPKVTCTFNFNVISDTQK